MNSYINSPYIELSSNDLYIFEVTQEHALVLKHNTQHITFYDSPIYNCRSILFAIKYSTHAQISIGTLSFICKVSLFSGGKTLLSMSVHVLGTGKGKI